MTRFNSHAYIRRVGKELVEAYGTGGLATTSGLKGEVREKAVRRRLEALLPRGMGVGTGCVFDGTGEASRQMDIIVYERDFCPAFGLEEEVAYYPAEGVIAVGEVKSVIGMRELEDIYEKIASVRKLRRFDKQEYRRGLARPKANESVIEWRTYFDKKTYEVAGEIEEFQNSSSGRQIYGFGIGEKFSADPEVMMDHSLKLHTQFKDVLRPNVVLNLKNELLAPARGKEVSYTAIGTSGIALLRAESSLEYLLVSLIRMAHQGQTGPLDAFEKYFISGKFTVNFKTQF